MSPPSLYSHSPFIVKNNNKERSWKLKTTNKKKRRYFSRDQRKKTQREWRWKRQTSWRKRRWSGKSWRDVRAWERNRAMYTAKTKTDILLTCLKVTSSSTLVRIGSGTLCPSRYWPDPSFSFFSNKQRKSLVSITTWVSLSLVKKSFSDLSPPCSNEHIFLN